MINVMGSGSNEDDAVVGLTEERPSQQPCGENGQVEHSSTNQGLGTPPPTPTDYEILTEPCDFLCTGAETPWLEDDYDDDDDIVFSIGDGKGRNHASELKMRTTLVQNEMNPPSVSDSDEEGQTKANVSEDSDDPQEQSYRCPSQCP
jgi:hypothetical protein